MNLIELLKDQLLGPTADRLSTAIGETPDTTRTALGAVIPALLSGLAGVAASPDGADRLKNAVQDINIPSMGDLGNMLGGDLGDLVQKGVRLLTSLFGSADLTTIISAIAAYSGLNPESTRKLLALALPFVLKMIAGQAKGTDAASLSSLLTSQKSDFDAALPNDFALPSFALASPLSDPGRPIARQTSTFPGWLPFLALAALAILAYLLWPNRDAADAPRPDQLAAAPKEGESTAPPDVPTLTGEYSDVLESLKETLGSIKDEPSGVAALPKLDASAKTVSMLRPQLDRVPAEARGPITDVISPALATIREQISAIKKIPIVGNKLTPVLDAIVGYLTI